ncbi:MAG TPA: GNAT family protein [Flavobacterium sp.]|nr:GNAT family protein [Flavobacterium sp.]
MMNWELHTIENILPEEFHELIQSNRDHIAKTFPVTLASCIDLEHTQDFISNNIEKQHNATGYFFYIRNSATKKLMGYVCIKNINNGISKCELAYFIDREFEGKGIISKAVSQVVKYCFEDLMMNKVFICTSTVNMASQRIATKHGFRQEGILREEFKNGDAILEDIVYFGLLKSDYHER